MSYLDGGNHDYGYSVVSDGSGALYATGSVSSASGGDDVLLVKLNTAGAELWRRTFDGSAHAHDSGAQVALAPGGDVLVAARTTEAGTGGDIAVLRYSPDGTLLWQFRYDGPASGYDSPLDGRPLAVDGTGHALISGISWGGASHYDAVLLRVAPDGALAWQRRFDGGTSNFDEYYAVELGPQGEVYVGGDTTGATSDFLLRKYDSAGQLMWSRLFDGPDGNNELLYDLCVTPSGDVAICGLSIDDQTGVDFATVLYDSAGNLVWSRFADGGSEAADTPFSIAAGPGDEIAVVGVAQDAVIGSSGLLVVYDALGNELLTDRVGFGSSWLTDVGYTSSGELIVVGRVDGFLVSASDALFRRYSTTGGVLQEVVHDNACHASDFLYSLTVDGNDDVFGAGSSLGSGGTVDMTVHRFP